MKFAFGLAIKLALSLSSTLILNSAVVEGTSYSATYLPYNAPKQSEEGQTGTNQCGTGSSQTSECQNLYVNAWDDFCLFAPPSNTSAYGNSAIGNTEQIEVAWCIRSGYGTRLIPPYAITGVHFVQTPDYVQITGWGDLQPMNIPAGDQGGELDPHGYNGLGNPVGGLVFGDSYNGTLRQYHEWTNFMSVNEWCIRVCPDAPNAPKYCEHVYDEMGCEWVMPGDYSEGFTSCEGDSTPPMGIYGTSTFSQGDAFTPAAHSPGATSNCQTFSAFTTNLPAVTPTASLFPSSVSASLSTASTASVASMESFSLISVASVSSTSTPTASGSSSGTKSSSATMKIVYSLGGMLVLLPLLAAPLMILL